MMEDDIVSSEASAEAGASCLAWTAAVIRILALWLVGSGSIALATAVASFGAVSNGTFAGSPPGRVVYPAFVAAASNFVVTAPSGRSRQITSDRRAAFRHIKAATINADAAATNAG
jgi:hypothetical protein